MPRLFSAILGFAVVLSLSCPSALAQQSAANVSPPPAAAPKPARAVAKKGDRKTAAKPLPCPEANYPDDPVCFFRPDEHTPPMPSSTAGRSFNRDDRTRWNPTGDDKLSVGVDWRASNESTGPRYGIESNLNSVRSNTPGGAANATPDTRGALGLDYKF